MAWSGAGEGGHDPLRNGVRGIGPPPAGHGDRVPVAAPSPSPWPPIFTEGPAKVFLQPLGSYLRLYRWVGTRRLATCSPLVRGLYVLKVPEPVGWRSLCARVV